MRSLTSAVRNRLMLTAFASAIAMTSIAVAQDAASGVVALNPDDMKWTKQSACSY